MADANSTLRVGADADLRSVTGCKIGPECSYHWRLFLTMYRGHISAILGNLETWRDHVRPRMESL